MIPFPNILILSIVVGMVLTVSLQHLFAAISQEASVFSKKTVCEACGAPQPFFHRIPIVAYFAARGKCSTCGHEPPGIYASLELAIFVFTLWAFSAMPPVMAFQISVLFFSLIGVTYMDLRKWIIPNEFVVYIITMGVFAIASGTVGLDQALLGTVVAGVVSLFIILPQRYGSGDKTLALGDVKLALAIGLWLGWVLSIYVFFLASLLALLTWMIIGLFRGFSVQRRVPFGPFVALSTMIFGIGRVLDPQFTTHLLTFRF